MNTSNFQAISFDYTGTKLSVGSDEIQIVSSVNVLDFLHIDRSCKSASNQLNAPMAMRLKKVLGSKKRRA